MLPVKNTNHFVSLNGEYGGGCKRRSRPHADFLPCQAALTEKVPGTQNCDDGLFADRVDYGKLHASCLNIHDVIGGLTLGIDARLLLELEHFSSYSG
jgi:hypothetical protein